MKHQRQGTPRNTSYRIRRWRIQPSSATPTTGSGERRRLRRHPRGSSGPVGGGVAGLPHRHGVAIQKTPERVIGVANLPMTATGKVQKHVLRQQAAQSVKAGRRRNGTQATARRSRLPASHPGLADRHPATARRPRNRIDSRTSATTGVAGSACCSTPATPDCPGPPSSGRRGGRQDQSGVHRGGWTVPAHRSGSTSSARTSADRRSSPSAHPNSSSATCDRS